MNRSTMPDVVAIDGPSGSGKSTVARRVAGRLGYRYLDTGALYRALTWQVLTRGADPADPSAVGEVLPAAALTAGTDPAAPTVSVADRDVSAEIRSPDVTAAVSLVARHPAVRTWLLEVQRAIVAAARPGIVVEGRDIGTTVVPDAPLKIFLTASPAERAARRHGQGELATRDVAHTRAALERRDALDAGRDISPLAQAPDAIVVDSTTLGIDDVVELVLRHHAAVRAGTSS